MTVKEIAKRNSLEIVAGEGALDRNVNCVYCCDLLSFAMSKAPIGSAWITVMNNVNVIAVASLADVACIIMVEGAQPDASALDKANEQNIPILKSKHPAFETAREIYNTL